MIQLEDSLKLLKGEVEKMKEGMFRKGLAFGIIILFIGSCVIPSTGTNVVKKSTIPTLAGNTLYVGGSGPGNYSSIQDAINDANDGDTVFVYDDSSPYKENIIIDKSIDLIGEDKDTTVMISKYVDNVISVSSEYVNISNFTIDGNNFKEDNIFVNSSYINIDNVIFQKNRNGIFTYWGSSYNKISDCVFKDCFNGILMPTDYNIVINNTFQNNSFGFDSSGSNNLIEGNIFTDGFCGIWMSGSGSLNWITQNVFIHCNEGLFYMSAYDNEIYDNVFSSNYYGMKFEEAERNNITSNLFINNSNKAIYIHYSLNNNIVGNNITSNLNGVYFFGSDNNVVKDNLILNSFESGLHFEYSDKNIVYHNSLINNTYNAKSNSVNFVGGNFWDDYTGFDNNSDGVGDIPYNFSGGTERDWYPIVNASFWPNIPPQPPIIYKEKNGCKNVNSKFYIYTIDLDDDDLFLCIDWDDGTQVDWIGPYYSGVNINFNHTWSQGTYMLRAKAKDIHGSESYWSEPLIVTIPVNQKGIHNNQQINQRSLTSPAFHTQNSQLLQQMIKTNK